MLIRVDGQVSLCHFSRIEPFSHVQCLIVTFATAAKFVEAECRIEPVRSIVVAGHAEVHAWGPLFMQPVHHFEHHLPAVALAMRPRYKIDV